MPAPPKIRLCQLTPCLWSGGTEERIARVLASLDRNAFELSWLGFGPIREALVERAGPGITVVPVARHVTGGVEPTLIAKLARTLVRLRPDVMHIHNWSTSLYGIAAARLAGVPVVMYGLGGQDSTEAPPPRRVRVMRAMAPQVDLFTAVCRYLGDEIEAHWRAPADRIRVLHTGIDLEEIDGAPSRDTVRERLGLPHDAIVVGAISVFRPVKRIPDLIDAAGLLAQQNDKLHVLLVGNPVGVSPDDLRARAEARGLAGRFHLLGRVERPARMLPAFDVFVNCSVFEGSSNAIIEAMAARIPIIATAVGGTPELVENGKHGLLVPPCDVPALAAALARMIDDEALRRACGEHGRERVERRHTHAAMVGAYRALYAEAAAMGPPNPRWARLASLSASVRAAAS